MRYLAIAETLVLWGLFCWLIVENPDWLCEVTGVALFALLGMVSVEHSEFEDGWTVANAVGTIAGLLTTPFVFPAVYHASLFAMKCCVGWSFGCFAVVPIFLVAVSLGLGLALFFGLRAKALTVALQSQRLGVMRAVPHIWRRRLFERSLIGQIEIIPGIGPSDFDVGSRADGFLDIFILQAAAWLTQLAFKFTSLLTAPIAYIAYPLTASDVVLGKDLEIRSVTVLATVSALIALGSTATLIAKFKLLGVAPEAEAWLVEHGLEIFTHLVHAPGFYFYHVTAGLSAAICLLTMYPTVSLFVATKRQVGDELTQGQRKLARFLSFCFAVQGVLFVHNILCFIGLLFFPETSIVQTLVRSLEVYS